MRVLLQQNILHGSLQIYALRRDVHIRFIWSPFSLLQVYTCEATREIECGHNEISTCQPFRLRCRETTNLVAPGTTVLPDYLLMSNSLAPSRYEP